MGVVDQLNPEGGKSDSDLMYPLIYSCCGLSSLPAPCFAPPVPGPSPGHLGHWVAYNLQRQGNLKLD